MSTARYQADVLVIGAGLAGVSTSLELLDQGLSVVLVDAASREQCGGQANDAFGGMLLCGTPEQKRNGIYDSSDLLWADWQRAACFQEDDLWAKRWAQAYCQDNRSMIYDWLKQRGIRFFPAVQWVERGNHGDGNALPRYHVAWGCGRGVVQTLLTQLLNHRNNAKFQLLCEHRVHQLEQQNGLVVGAQGTSPQGDFVVQAEHSVLCSGGINGSLARVRQHWDPIYGPCPENLLNGTDPRADGSLHDKVRQLGGQVVKLGQMWNYAAGIAHPKPQYPAHGVSLIPARSALWLEPSGKRIGPMPLVTGFDTHDLCKKIGHLPGQYGWQVLNWKIAIKELAISGTDSNPLFRDKKLLPLVWQTLTGNKTLVNELLQYPDVLHADSLEVLAHKMRQLAGDQRLDIDLIRADIQTYDAIIERGPALHNDDQLRRIAQLRQWKSDKLRTCKFQKILDPSAGPLIAIRTRIIGRKSMGGMLTDLNGRIIDNQGQALRGLYAAGESTGFGGGGISGIRSLEGTFLSNCIFNGRRAALSIAGKL